ncbi:MAG TPA: hypothetical protein VNN09_08505 [Candidatus Competibacteraceae bacterium]|nr:hypothetical protein [Candidatus Competibacteraceae bacterium]
MPVSTIPDDYAGWRSLREIDQAHGLPKGSAFRAFKRARLTEGEDFLYLAAERHGEIIAELKAAGRLYRSTVHAVLISARGYEKLQQFLPGGAEGGTGSVSA